MLATVEGRNRIGWLLVAVLMLIAAGVAVAVNGGWSPKLTGALVFVFGALAVLVAVLLELFKGSTAELMDPVRTEDLAVRELEHSVRLQWLEEQIKRHLTETVPVLVTFHIEQPEVSSRGDRRSVRSDVGTASEHDLTEERTIDELHAIYLGLKRKRMLMVGDGGTGKTAALILLVIKAIEERAQHPENPVPVLLTAAEWNPDPRRGESLYEWMVQTVYNQHRYLETERYGKEVVERLINGGRIALLLDGLDEMPEEHRKQALTAIGAETRFRIVATSRSEELERAIEGGAFPGGVAFAWLKHVPAVVGGAWLQQDQPLRLREAWAIVARAMREKPAGALAQALNTPLWLSFARSSYKSSSSGRALPTELLSESHYRKVDQIRSHLLERVLAQELSASRYEIHGRRYLTSFAHRFDPVGFNWWRIRDLAPRLPVIATVATAAVAGSVVIGVTSGDSSDSLRFGLLFLSLGAIVGSLIVSFASWRGARRLQGSVPRQCVAISLGLLYGFGISIATRLGDARHQHGFALLAGAVLGVLLGVSIGLIALHDGPMLAARRFPSRRDIQAALVAGAACTIAASSEAASWRALAAGATAVLGFAGAVGLTRPDDIPGANLGPLNSYRADRRGSLVFGAIGGCAIAIGAGLGVPHSNALTAIGAGVLAGVAVGAAGAFCASQAAALACIGFWLRLTGNRGPAAIVPFLEFARVRNLIRVSGTAYQFRHQELREYLLRAPDPPEA